MKLIDILNLIPEDEAISVALYDDNDEMFYGYIVGPKLGDRNELEREHNRQVVRIGAGTVRAVTYENPIPCISIDVRCSLKEES